MEIINLHKECNKKNRKVLQLKALSNSDEPKKGLSKSDEPKKVPGSIDNPSREKQKLKKASSNEKKITTKAGKKVKKTPQPKKAPTSPEFVDADSDDMDDEQGAAAKCRVMYSIKDEQEPTVKKSDDDD